MEWFCTSIGLPYEWHRLHSKCQKDNSETHHFFMLTWLNNHGSRLLVFWCECPLKNGWNAPAWYLKIDNLKFLSEHMSNTIGWAIDHLDRPWTHQHQPQYGEFQRSTKRATSGYWPKILGEDTAWSSTWIALFCSIVTYENLKKESIRK